MVEDFGPISSGSRYHPPPIRIIDVNLLVLECGEIARNIDFPPKIPSYAVLRDNFRDVPRFNWRIIVVFATVYLNPLLFPSSKSSFMS